MGLPVALVIGACMVGVMMGDSPNVVMQVKYAHDVHHYTSETRPARQMAAVRLHSYDHMRGVKIYG